MVPPTEMMIVVIEELEAEERQPCIGVAAIVMIVVISIVIVIVVTCTPMTVPPLVAVIPAIASAAVPSMHFLHKIVADCRHRCLCSGQAGR
jgi:hypothetical protein